MRLRPGIAAWLALGVLVAAPAAATVSRVVLLDKFGYAA
jgi:hypothetical protein